MLFGINYALLRKLYLNVSMFLNRSILQMVMKGGEKGYEEEYFWNSWYF